MKKFTFFATLIVALFSLSLNGWGQVALPHLDPINYTVGEGLQTQTGWTSLNSGDALLITSGSLSYPGLPSSTGNKVAFDGSGIDAAKLITQQTSGTVYYSFLLNVSALGSLSTTGGYFSGFTEGVSTTFGGTIWTRADGTGIDIGLNPRTTVANTVWTSGTTSINSTLLVVISYQIVSGTTNDVVKLWINPAPGAPEPAATLTATNTLADLANVNRILIRQDGTSATPFIEMDEIRIGTSWGDVTPLEGSIPFISVAPTGLNGFNYIAGSGPSTTQTFLISGSDLTDNISLAAPADYEISLASGSGYTTPIVLNQSSGTVGETTIFVRLKAGLAAGTYNGQTINITSSGATPATVTCNGSVTATTPQLVADPNILTGFTYGFGSSTSPSNYFLLDGLFLEGFPGELTVTGSTNYEVSLDDENFFSSVQVPFSSATLTDFPVMVRLKLGLAQNTYNGELISISGGNAPTINVTCSGSVTAPVPNAACTLRPSHMDISTATSESAVFMTLSNYGSNLAKYRIYGTTQFNCWNETTDEFISSSTYADGPSVPGTPMTTTSFWILFQRGSTATTDGTYRDRLDPYSGNYQTRALTPAITITTPFSLSGNFVPTGGYDNSIKHVVLGYSGATLVSAVSTTLSTGIFTMVCQVGTTIDKIEVRAIDNTLIASITGTWTVTTNVGSIPAGSNPIVSTPVITPLSGNYYAPFSATISCITAGSSIYYTTDGSDPNNTGNGTLYTIPVPVSTTTTLKAIAYAPAFDASSIATEVYNFPVIVNVANIAALRAGLTDGTVYRLTGEAVLTFKTITRNAKYIQDATGAILIDDSPGKITTVYNIYDGITGITGTLFPFNSMLQFVPVQDPGAASSTGNTVVPEEVSLLNMTTAYQAKLVKVLNTTITGTGNFLVSSNYTLTDPSGPGVLRTQYADLNYLGTAIPSVPQDMIGVVLQNNAVMQLVPRSLADFSASSGAILTATPNQLTGFVYNEGNGPSTSQSYVLNGSGLSGYPGNITVTGSAAFEVSTDDVSFGATRTIAFTTSNLGPVTVYVRLKAGLTSGVYNAEAVSNTGGGILVPVNVLCSGTVMATEPTNHASGFTATAPVYNAITLTWSDNDGVQPADGYLILASKTNAFTTPVDFIPQDNNETIGTGTGVMNVAHGVQTYTWPGLDASTTYYFEIYPFTNQGAQINYKTTPAAPAATATTPANASDPVAAWTFDTNYPSTTYTTPNSMAASYGVQTGIATIYADGTNGSSSWITVQTGNELNTFTGTTINDPRASAISGYSYCALGGTNNAANGKSWVLKFSMTGYQDPILTFATRFSSATGFSTHQWAWSTDGTTFTNFGTNTAPLSTAFAPRALDLSSIDALDGAATVYLRITFSGSTSGTSNNRLDNFVIHATGGPSTKTLNLTNVRLEHLYEPGTGTMKQAYNATGPQYSTGIADMIIVELHDAATYNTILHTATVALSTTGVADVTDIPSSLNGSYRITIRHRNSIETTSALPVDFSAASVLYSFNAPSSAYGNNLKLIEGLYWIYGGDVNQDGQVEQLDVTEIENGVNTFAKGYLNIDVDGSGDLGINDYTIWENDNNAFARKKTP